jgi:hypothetical protein
LGLRLRNFKLKGGTFEIKRLFRISLVLVIILLFFTSIFTANLQTLPAETTPSQTAEIINQPRQTNADTEPNNDFSTAVPVVYHSSGTTHLTTASVGASDPYDFWKI